MKISTKEIILVSLFSALMAVGAFIRIPFPLLPVTLQPFFCAFAGIMLGARLGALSQVIYLVVGIAGLPVFTHGGGIMYIFEPSFGFLIGFAAGAFIIGKIAHLLGKTGFKQILAAVMSGLIVIYAAGIIYMYMILSLYLKSPGVNILYVISINIPYFIKDIILYIIVAIVSSSVIPVLKRAGLITSH